MSEANGERVRPITEIDPLKLDEEWINQPKKVEKYARRLTEAKFDLAEAKAQLDATAAELAFKIRSKPTRYGMDKVTDQKVKDAIILQDEYQEALRNYNGLRKTVDLLEGIMTALEHRKKALENLVYLHGQSYFSAPVERRKR